MSHTSREPADSASPGRTELTALQHGLAAKFHSRLARPAAGPHALEMFLVTEADADAIRTIFDQEGELLAAIELSIAGWTPVPVQPRPVTRLRPRKDG
jgi:hypothetical protein